MELGDENVDQEIRDFVTSQEDIEIDKYSDVGCNGDLYFGNHKIFNERVALKFYYLDNKGLSHKEPQILRGIDHDNILKVHEAKKISDNYAYFLTSEFSGGDLDKFMKENSLSTHQALNIVHDILKGVTEMHKNPHRLLHRDLKPNNILIEQETLKACIADFGSIKQLPKKKTSIPASKNSLVYRPKETIDSNEYNFQSDVYQIGLILFQLLGGYFPDAMADWLSPTQKKKLKNISDIFEQHQFIEKAFDNLISKNKLLKFETLPFYIDDTLKSILRKATRPELNNRYKSTAEFMNAIYQYKNKSKDWLQRDEDYFATKSNGTTYRLFKSKGKYHVEKTIVGSKTPRKMNKHDNTLEGAYNLVKKE